MHISNEITTSLEEKRLKVLKEYEILDTPPDGGLDSLTKLAARLLNIPIAVISFVDQERIWYKSHYGILVQEVPRETGFCSSAILSEEVYVIEDTTEDSRVNHNSLVTGKEKVRFYAAAPLKIKEGYNLGAFCIMDRKPRSFSAADKEILQTIADLAIHQLELRVEARTAVKNQHHLLNTTAHDLKNPLSIMPLLADLIMENKNNPKAIDDIAQQIKEAGKRMAGTIEELLETALEDAGRIHLRMKALDLSPLVLGVINSNMALAKKKKQILHLDIQQDCSVYADPGRLSEILDNLVNNAIKYSPLGKNIFIAVKAMDHKAVIEVKDEGPGLTKDDLKNLYRRFTSLSAQPTGGEKSSGLGLSIVKKLVEAHRGKIYAVSEGPGRGSTFTVELPLSESC